MACGWKEELAGRTSAVLYRSFVSRHIEGENFSSRGYPSVSTRPRCLRLFHLPLYLPHKHSRTHFIHAFVILCPISSLRLDPTLCFVLHAPRESVCLGGRQRLLCPPVHSYCNSNSMGALLPCFAVPVACFV